MVEIKTILKRMEKIDKITEYNKIEIERVKRHLSLIGGAEYGV